MKVTATFIAVSLLITNANADWLQWRGPNGNGVALDAAPPTKWSASENIAWKREIPGRGSSTPVIVGNKIFLTTAIATEESSESKEVPDAPFQFVVMCFDRTSGEVLWKKTTAELVPHSGHHSDHGYASASPVTDGVHVWAHFGSRGTFCLTVAGDLVWSRTDLGKMETRGGFGDGSSPALHGGKLIVPWDHEGDSYITALDAKTGKTVWKTAREEGSSWTTPCVIEQGGKAIVVQSGPGFARAYDLADGKELWHAEGQTGRPVASPVSTDGMVFVGSGFRGAFLAAYKLDGATGDITDSDSVVWSLDKGTPDVPSLLLSDGRLYFHAARNGILSCHDARTGKAHYSRERIDGLRNVYASPVAAGGFIFLTARDGTTVVIKDSPKLEVVATCKLGEPVDATPVPDGSEMFIRGEKHLYCISTKSS
ncbi:MAG: outer membrane protein assembly factor BamB [Verrucomicrobiales bacterium]|jgi:outer membrane protein assembly factor BamB